MDARQLDTMMLWFGVFAIVALSGAPLAFFDLVRRAFYRWERKRIHRQNMAVVARIQIMQAIESGVDRE